MTSIAKNERISHMNDIKDRKVAQHNDLITSVAKMDKTPLKIFELAVSCIDTDNPPKENIVYLSKSELFAFFDVFDSNKHTRFKEAVEKMQKQAYFQIKENKDLGIEYESIVPIPTVRWNDYNDEVLVRFNPDIMPYLIDLRKNFTQYAITDIMDLESKYSIILYKWLCMNFNQFENYQFKNNRTQKQLEEYQNPKISIRDFRVMTDTTKLLERFTDLEKRVIKSATKEISEYTHFNVSYDKIKKGRSITDIQFHIEKKAHWKDEEYKRNDEVAQLSKEQREQEENALFTKAISSSYTRLLADFELINIIDMMKQETIVGFAKHVYPLYDEIVKVNGEKALTEHLGYVKDNRVDYAASKKNIVKYLQIAARQYLDNGVDTIVAENKKQRAEEKKATRNKQVKEVPEWSNADYVETTTDDEKAKFAEWQKSMRN